MENRKANILGTEYTIEKRKISDDYLLESRDGYCDSTIKSIVTAYLKAEMGSNIDVSVEEKRLLRHECIHGFLYESGLDENCEWAKNEEVIDWIALQFPKMDKLFRELDIL